jgi:hypothetical protein
MSASAGLIGNPHSHSAGHCDQSRRASYSSKPIEYDIAPSRAEERLREEAPIFALIRQWCGQESVEEFEQIQALRAEVGRLRKLVESTATWLRDAGHPQKAARLLKDLNDVGESRAR